MGRNRVKYKKYRDFPKQSMCFLTKLGEFFDVIQPVLIRRLAKGHAERSEAENFVENLNKNAIFWSHKSHILMKI